MNTTSRSEFRLTYVLLVGLLVFSPLYYKPNFGSFGLGITLNISTWIMALWFISVVAIIGVRSGKIVINKTSYYFLLFPVIIILTGLVSDVPEKITWLFRQLYVLGGILFLFSLFQLKLTTKHIESLLYLLVGTVLLQALVGLLHVLGVRPLFIPPSLQHVPVGFFQQVNVLATYLATGVIIILYLVSRPSFYRSGFFIRLLLIVTWTLAIYIIVYSGSRIGILSTALGASLLMISRWQQLGRHKVFMLVLGVTFVLALISGQTGLERAVEKSKQITDVEYASARRAIYSISLDLIKEKPLLGHGIGSFPKVWADKISEFNGGHQKATVPQTTLTHPHNEIFFWFIEGGIASVIGIFVIISTIGFSLFRCGFSRGGAYAALILPISLHTQVEIPFYVSSVHWFLWIFLVFMALRHQQETFDLKITNSARLLLKTTVICIMLGGTFFLIQSQKAVTEITSFIYKGKGNLQVGLDNLYFAGLAEKLLMQNLLNLSIRQNTTKQIPEIIDWAEKHIQSNPDLFSFVLLSKAYAAMGKKQEQCRIARKGLSIYTKNKKLRDYVTSCSE